MSFTDFNQSIKNIIKDLMNSNDNVPPDNFLEMFDYFKELHIFRHNFLHLLVLRTMGLNWSEEKKISDFFDFEFPENIARKTPDIFFYKNEKWWLIDVSLSIDVAKTELEKKEKYMPIVDFLNSKNIPTIYIHLNIKSTLENIEKELEKISVLTVSEFRIRNMTRIMDIIEEKKKWVHQNIDKEKFEYLKYEEFKKKNETNFKNEEIFRDELKYEQIGQYGDLDIELDIYEKFNAKFDTVEKIENSLKIYKEEDMVNYLRKILDNKKSPQYKAMMDQTLNIGQFNTAKETIKQENDKKVKRIPKPTHHLLIPFADDIQNDGVNEQESLLKFAKTLIEDYKSINYTELNKNIQFVHDVCLQLNWCVEQSEDKELNIEFYKRQDDLKVNYRKDYEKLNAELAILNAFKRKRKVSNKLLGKINFEFDKEDKSKLNDLRLVLEEKLKKYDQYTGKTLSFREYLRSIDVSKVKDDKPCILGNKQLKTIFGDYKPESKLFFQKTGINFIITEKKENVVPKENHETIDWENKNDVDFVLKYLMEKTKRKDFIYKEEDFLLNKENLGSDSIESLILKEQMINNYTPYYNFLKETNCYNYLKNAHHFYQQLMHATQLKSQANNFYFYNCGISNCMVVVALSFTDKKKDYGKPFMCVLKTKNPELYNSFFGKLKKIKIPNTDYTYVLTNWRRLNLSKITFMRDCFYSVLSSTMNSIMSSPSPTNYMFSHKAEHTFALRTIISYSTNQKIAELLMDTRYAYMSALSSYTNIQKLLEEKFAPPYTTSLEIWIIDRLLERLPLIHKKTKDNGILQSRIEMRHNVRDTNTIGGKINLPSIWGDYIMLDITELIDEAFIYVHTMKEPANIFHENIKAIKTIQQFQNEYDQLNEKQKMGLLVDEKDWDDLLFRKTKIGCCSPLIVHSMNYTLEKEKPFFKKIIHNINDESIGELLSTKAVIADVNRTVEEDKEIPKREFKKKKKRMMELDIPASEISDDKIKFYVLTTNNRFYNKYKTRQKVMETTLEVVEKDNNINTTVKLANHHIKNENGFVVADICIKAQYGSKREFYVVNIGAKATARVCENFFKELCKNSPNEAISVPGDKKTIRMQQMLDKVFYNPITEKHKMIYVNGDCTKWSAAETMASFLSMCIALKSKITPKMYNMLLSTFNAWGDKQIQIPMDIYNKVIPIKNKKTDFLREKLSLTDAKMHSTQNFLQGMFNYSSSYKAVCCINYTYYLWKKIRPKSNLLLEHLEHSDDYVLLCLYESQEEFEDFRVLQKIVMKMHGYNDSDRKTSCQPYLMEFVSQMSFNGVMLYPQIKKSKEINLNLPCTGYKIDMDAAMSRVGECMRVGCNLSFLYFFQRLHAYCIADAYSILPKMTNNFDRTIKDLFNEPIELFGIPDINPIFSLYCRGNGNNYRLFNYGDESSKNKIIFLYKKALYKQKKETTLNEDIDYKYSLDTPRFMYEILGKSTKNLRSKIGITNEEIADFWEKNISYKFIKPKHVSKLIPWIKCMFYNRTFLEAYAKSTRTMMTMRLSTFVKNKIIKLYIDPDDYRKPEHIVLKQTMTIEDYYFTQINEIKNYDFTITKKDYNNLTKIITKCDPTFSAIYSIISKIKINNVRCEKERTIQVVLRTPSKIKTINITNDPNVLLQYLYNHENFLLDKRVLISKVSLDKDIEEIKKRIDPEILSSNDTMNVLSVYNDLMINKEKRIVCFGFTRDISLLVDSIVDYYTNNFTPGKILNVNYAHVITILDPITNEVIYSKGARLTIDFYRQCCENIALLFVYFTKTLGYTLANFKRILNEIKFKLNDNETNKEYIYDYKQVLEKLTNDYLKLNDYNLEDKKIIGVLKSLLINDNDVLNELSNSIYAFSYKYLLRDNPIGGEFLSRTEVVFTYFNTTVLAIYDKKLCDVPILFVNKYYDSVINILYNIAIKLTTGLSDEMFERTLNTDRLKDINLEKHSQILLEMNKYKIIKVIGEDNDTKLKKQINVKDIKTLQKAYPIFVIRETIHRGSEHKLNVGKVYPTYDDKNMCVKLGKSKLFTFPYWRCHQYDNMIIENEKLIDNIYLSSLLDNRLLEKHLNEKILYRQKEIKLPKTNISTFKLLIYNQIKKQKIYNIDWSNLFDINDNNLVDILKHENMNIKYFEKKYMTTKDTYLQTEPHVDYEILRKLVKPNIDQNSKTYELKDDFLVDDYGDIDPDMITEDEEYKKMGKEEVIDLKPENVDEILKKHATTFNFKDEFLIEDEIVDNIPELGMEFIDEDIEDTRYRGKEMLDFIKMDDYIKDFFVIPPKKEKQRNIEGINYMVNKLKILESLYLTQYMYDHKFTYLPDHLDVCSFLHYLKNTINLLNVFKDEENQEILLMFLYHLLCKTFLVNNKKENIYRLFYLNNEIYLCVKFDELDEEEFELLKKQNRAFELESNYFLVKTTFEKFMNLFYNDVKSNSLTIMQPKIPIEIDEKIKKMNIQNEKNRNRKTRLMGLL